jgi:transposase
VCMREHEGAIARLVAIPGIRLQSAQQIIAEVGLTAQTFQTPGQFSAWIGVCPGREESAGDNHSSRCPKGNAYLRRVLCQSAQAAVRTKNCFFQQKFQRLLPRLGYQKALWAIARRLSVVIWIILHEGVCYEERGGATTAQAAQRRHQRLIKELREAGYTVELSKPNLEAYTDDFQRSGQSKKTVSIR